MKESHLEDVKAFHKAFNIPIKQQPDVSEPDRLALRSQLIREEAAEVIEALQEADLPQIAHELADLYIAMQGTILELGLQDIMDEAFKRVHLGNMSKLGPDGKPVYREDGKVLKGPNYQKPDMQDLFETSFDG